MLINWSTLCSIYSWLFLYERSVYNISMLYKSKLGFVISFNWKNDQWNAAHLFCFYMKKVSTVFPCFTYRNPGFVIPFNWKNDQRNAAHLFCFIWKKCLQYFHVLSIVIWVLSFNWKMISGMRRIFSVFIGKKSLQYFHASPIEIDVL